MTVHTAKTNVQVIMGDELLEGIERYRCSQVGGATLTRSQIVRVLLEMQLRDLGLIEDKQSRRREAR
jgi:hypothetical protein